MLINEYVGMGLSYSTENISKDNIFRAWNLSLRYVLHK